MLQFFIKTGVSVGGFLRWLVPLAPAPKLPKYFTPKFFTQLCNVAVELMWSVFLNRNFEQNYLKSVPKMKKRKKKTNKQSQSGRIRSDLGFFFHTSFARWVDTSYFYKKNSVQKIYLISWTYSFSAWCPRKGHTHFCLSMYDL